jgi:hypothetical protein
LYKKTLKYAMVLALPPCSPQIDNKPQYSTLLFWIHKTGGKSVHIKAKKTPEEAASAAPGVRRQYGPYSSSDNQTGDKGEQ